MDASCVAGLGFTHAAKMVPVKSYDFSRREKNCDSTETIFAMDELTSTTMKSRTRGFVTATW